MSTVVAMVIASMILIICQHDSFFLMNFPLNKIMGLLISLRAIATAKNKTKVRSEYPK